MKDADALAALLPDIPDWQKLFIDDMLAGRVRYGAIMYGRSGGRMQAHRYALVSQLIAAGHAHVAARDGLWCVTGDRRQLLSLGPLWERLPKPQGPRFYEIRDEDTRMVTRIRLAVRGPEQTPECEQG